jgi:drug/metabolite transporter (DMT)-like permease
MSPKSNSFHRGPRTMSVEFGNAPGGGARSLVLLANLVCTLSMLTWAMAFPAAEFLLQSWSALPLIAIRLVLAALALLGVWVAVEGPGALRRANWLKGGLIGALGFGASAWLLLWGQAISDPVTVAVITAALPAVGAALEVMLDGRRVRARFLLGIGFAIAGGIIATGRTTGLGAAGWGALLSLISVVLYAWGSRAAMTSRAGLSTLGVTAVTMTGAALFGLVALAWGLATDDALRIPASLDAEQIGAILLYALIATAASQLLWLIGVGHLGVAVASVHINAAPFYVMLMLLSLGGAWHWNQAFGAGLVAIGVLAAQQRSSAGA